MIFGNILHIKYQYLSPDSHAVDYARGQLPRCLLTADYTIDEDRYRDEEAVELCAHIAITPSGHVIAICSGRTLQFFAALPDLGDGGGGGGGARCDATFDDVHSKSDDEFCGCMRMFFTPHDDGRHLLVAIGRLVRAYHNVTGLRVRVLATRKRLAETNVTSALRERLQQQMAEDEERLRALNVN